jgi:hypothetical protein
MAYQGEGAYAGLKVAAVVSVILAGIVAVALWFGANDPRIVIDASGGPSITTDPDPAVIAAGVLVLGEGLLFGSSCGQSVRSEVTSSSSANR